ncbi:phosphodiesterase [Klebsiella pneumoniae]|nr:phosphodiesterase [Klebsiella pneumoniae]
MNFLAHLHLAHLADSSLPGNLMADFVRGNPQGDYPAEIIDGIFMHRRIDVMTDNLAEVKEAREWFRPQTRRVAPHHPRRYVGSFPVPALGAALP